MQRHCNRTRRMLRLGVLAGAVLAVPILAKGEVAYPTGWIRQNGTTSQDRATGVAADGLGNVFVGGYTAGALSSPNGGQYDAFISMFSTTGQLAWTQQVGGNVRHFGNGVAADGQGNAYLAGQTFGSLYGSLSGTADAFVRKYDSSGATVWTRQVGSSGLDTGYGVASNAQGDVYISGSVGSGAVISGAGVGSSFGGVDAFISKYSASGDAEWTTQFGTSLEDIAYSVVTDGNGNIFVGGATRGTMAGQSTAGGQDGFVSKLDDAGNVVWTKQFGTTGVDVARSVAVDASGNVYVGGDTLNSGNRDVFVRKYDWAGNLLWTQSVGTSSTEFGYGLSTDRYGDLYVTGSTAGSDWGANPNLTPDIFVLKYNPGGNLIWKMQVGTGVEETGRAIGTDPSGNPFIAGETKGPLSGAAVGSEDIFLIKLANPMAPLPGSAWAGLALLTGLGVRRWRRNVAARQNAGTF